MKTARQEHDETIAATLREVLAVAERRKNAQPDPALGAAIGYGALSVLVEIVAAQLARGETPSVSHVVDRLGQRGPL